jgi:hypothetical protein
MAREDRPGTVADPAAGRAADPAVGRGTAVGRVAIDIATATRTRGAPTTTLADGADPDASSAEAAECPHGGLGGNVHGPVSLPLA